MKWKKSEVIAVILFGLVAAVAVIKLSGIFLEYMKGSIAYRELEEYVFLPEEQDSVLPAAKDGRDVDSAQAKQDKSAAASQAVSSSYEECIYYGQSPQVDFEGLRAKNSDVAGWIYGPDTVINYPVVQGADNEFYLTHMFDGRENKCGSIFMDTLNREDFSDSNSILYGHHMKNGSMFAGLIKYQSQSYYDSHPVLWLVTPDKSYRVEVFAGFVTSADSEVWQLEFADSGEYRSWLDRMVGNSAFESNISPGTDDRVLTLATCSYEYDDARFVVMGILREQVD